MDALSIRRARSADADVIALANIAMAAETEGRRLDRDQAERAVRRALADAALGAYWLAERGGNVVGQLLVTTEFSDWRDGVFWWIQSVYVAPAARRTGVYRALHEHVVQEARRTPHVCGVRLYVDRHNATAQAVYRRLGMHETGYLLFEADWSRA